MKDVSIIMYDAKGEAHTMTEHGLTPLHGRLVTIGKVRDWLIVAAINGKGVKLAHSQPSPHAAKILVLPMDGAWELTYPRNIQAIMATKKQPRCKTTREGIDLDGSRPILQCTKRLEHTGAHNFVHHTGQTTQPKK
jgi:hypothetical protein